MKRFALYTLLSSAAFLSSCDKQLDQVPSSARAEGQSIETVSDLKLAINGVYAALNDQNEEALLPAVGRCRHYFFEYWGQTLLESLTALHHIYTLQLQAQDDDEDEHQTFEEEGDEASTYEGIY